MHGLNLFGIYCEKFSTIGARYMVTGSVASMLYGEPRFTHDIDMVVLVDSFQIDELLKNFPAHEIDSPPPEVVAVELRRQSGGHFNLIHHETGFKADVYLRDIRDSFINWSFEHIKFVQLPNLTVPVAPPEYVIVNKLIYYRQGGSEKHLSDIAGIQEHLADQIDWSVVSGQANRYGLQAELQRIRDRSK